MKLLLDTHILLRAAGMPRRLPAKVRRLLGDSENLLLFSSASIWEIAIKRSLERDDFSVDPRILRRGMMDNGCEELPVRGAHVVAECDLPPIHKDPFDRMLIAQATVEAITLVTSDSLVARYPGPIEKV